MSDIGLSADWLPECQTSDWSADCHACDWLNESRHEPSMKLCPQAYHQYGLALLEWSRMESEVFEYTMEGFTLGESKLGEPKVVVEETEKLTQDEVNEIVEEVGDALEENYEAVDIAAKIHFEEDFSDNSSSEDSDTSDDDSEGEGSEEEEDEVVEDLEEATNLDLSWEVLELARIIYTRSGQKEKLGCVLLALGEVSMERQDYDQAVRDFTESLVVKMDVLPMNSRYNAALVSCLVCCSG